MRKIATWSRHYKTPARLLITVCHIIIASLACYVGISLQANHIHLPVQVLCISILLFLLITVVFSRAKYGKLQFFQKKAIDVSIVVCSFIMIVASSNQPDTRHFVFNTSLQGALPQKIETGKQASINELKRQWKEIKIMAKKEGASTIRIVTAILVGLFLSMLVAALSCSASCNGHGALAAIVLIGGLGAVFFIVRAIIRGGRRRHNSPSVSPSQ